MFSEESQKLLEDMNVKQRSSKIVRMQQNFKVLIAFLLRKSGLFVAVAGEI